MPLEPPSKRPEFAGFAEHYDAVIAPYLRAKDGERRAAAGNFFILTGSLGLLAAAVAWRGPFGEANFQVGALVAIVALAAATWLLNRSRDDIALGLFERICAGLGFAFRLKPGRPDDYAAFRRLGLLPEHNRESWEDEVSGVHAGARFVLCEAHLQYETSSGKNHSIRTVFHGQLFALDYPQEFLGTTVIRRDAGVFNALMKPESGLARVGLASGEFEKAFEAWSTDQVEARALLDPVVLERFVELERLFNGKSLRAAFAQGELLVAVETGDRLNMGSMFAPLESEGRVATILKEFDAIFDLIDAALRPVEGRMAGAFSLDQVKGD